MECPGLLQWVAAEVVLGAIDVALGVLRRRVKTLSLEFRRRRHRVRWNKCLRDREETEEGARGWDRVLGRARQERDIVEREYYKYKWMYMGYRAYHNGRWGLDASSRWQALPAFARRGYPGA